MHDPTDHHLKAMLQQHWQAPPASSDAAARLLEAARTLPSAPFGSRAGARWTLPGAAVAAALAALWLVSPRPAPPVVQTDLDDEAVMAYVFATYDLEETL
jgi:hypothetical protein